MNVIIKVDKSEISYSAFRIRGFVCELYFSNSKLILPLRALKFKKKYKRTFVSEQPDAGWIFYIDYYVFIKRKVLSEPILINLTKY